MKTAILDLGPLATPVDPEAVRLQQERNELMRIAAQSALDRSRGGRDLDPDARAWAKHWASIKPLGRPLSTGEPAVSAHQHTPEAT